MATSTSQDGSEDVSDFLRRIKELGDTPNDDEDDKHLEQEILESKALREARRAERARSLSPEKRPASGSIPVPPSAVSPAFKDPALADRPVLSPTRDLNSRPLPNEPQRSTKDLLASDAPQSARPSSTSSRTGALSWQQRPSSLLGPRSRPISMGGSNTMTQGTADHGDPSKPVDRAQIAKALGQKDPAWFRQTEDRGPGSAALRKSEGEGDTLSDLAAPQQLHGLFRKSSGESTLRQGHSDGADGPSSANSAKDQMEANSSPTRGVGAFGESARIRRAESVNKRWSAQASAGLARQNSTSGFRGQLGYGISNASPLRSSRLIRTSHDDGRDQSETGSTNVETDAAPAPSTPKRSRSPTKASFNSSAENGSTDRTPTHSPQKRWSPVKASWLENALNKPPESPRTRHTPSQPGWLSDLNKNRQARMSKDESQMAPPSSPSKPSRDIMAMPGLSSRSGPEKPKSPAAPTTKPKPTRLSDTTAPAEMQSQTPLDESNGDAQSPPADNTKAVTMGKESVEKKKPETPPKKDFRPLSGSARPRTVQTSQGELEFQNAFGKLKRAQTQNYVAPDELKDNITRGKAGLAVTGGPQKSERKDEFKESLLRQKASMNEKGADPRATPSRPTSIDRKPPTPEAIAKRRAMGRNDSQGSISTSSKQPVKLGAGDNAPSPPVPNESKPASTLRSSTSDPSSAHTSAGTKATGGIGGRLAGRFNPALAGMIARGPPSSKEPRASPDASDSARRSAASESPAAKPAQLDHMTKARARGPKRRPPKSGETASSETAPGENPSSKISKTSDPVGESTVVSSVGKPDSDSKLPEASTEQPEAMSRDSPKPGTPSKPPSLASAAAVTLSGRPASMATEGNLSSGSFKPNASLKSVQVINTPPLSPKKEDTKIASKPDHSYGGSVRAATSRWGQSSSIDKVESAKPKEPIKLPTRNDEDLAAKEAGLGQSPEAPLDTIKPKIAPKSPALLRTPVKAASASDRDTSSAPVDSTASRSADSNQDLKSTAKSQQPSPRSQSSEASQVFADFFDAAPKAPEKLTVNVSDILSSNLDKAAADSGTVGHEISILGGDGKRMPIASSQQPVLYDTKTYLVKHVMKTAAAGQRVEVYMWSGSAVAPATAEDGQLFAKKYARESGGTLQVFQQGKEPAKFFQALGDIVITRRGDGSADGPYMLCCRKYLGQCVAFDEVTFSLSSFCSGFPFIIVGGTTSKTYLWKGKGCSTDELANAQMTSMDLSPAGEVTPVEEGSEPADLVDLFPMPSGRKPVKAVPRSAEHWKLKSQHGNYGTRLFHVSYDEGKEAGRGESLTAPSSPGAALWNLMGRRGSQADASSTGPQRVKEISPFCQADLDRTQIYVLDAFFEVYVIVGPDSRGNGSAFATALLFAQDYSILAAGGQDRPFVPVGTVVMQGTPRDLKACFRGWDEKSGLFGRVEEQGASGKSLRIVPLSAALVAAK